jgi:hypothetical protein
VAVRNTPGSVQNQNRAGSSVSFSDPVSVLDPELSRTW